MGGISVIFYIIIGILLVLLFAALIRNRKIHKDIDKLTESVDKFIKDGTKIEFSTKDNHFSTLQNSVTELQDLFCLEKNNTAKELKEKAEFIADISHQLKTPLAGIKLYAELEKSQHPNLHIDKELILVEKMENFIYKLLRLEKIKSDAYTMDFKLESINVLGNRVANEFKALFNTKTFTVSGDSKIRIDKEWMYEALSNVVKNSCEHTDENGKISILVEDGEKSTTVTVADNGGGVSADDLPKLFSRFQRTENSEPNSAGIGLAITKAIVEKHHGTISAKNSNDGLEIIICLPKIDGYRAI